MRPECPDQTRCLHLAASAGVTSRLDGPFRRFPLGAREVGKIPLDRRPFVTSDGEQLERLADPLWLATHGIRGFAALPLEFDGDCIGVLAVFARDALGAEVVRALESTARLGALALGSTRAVAGESEVLRPLAESEREIIEKVLAHTGGRVSGPRGAARILGLKPTTLFSRMKKLGVRRAPA